MTTTKEDVCELWRSSAKFTKLKKLMFIIFNLITGSDFQMQQSKKTDTSFSNILGLDMNTTLNNSISKYYIS